MQKKKIVLFVWILFLLGAVLCFKLILNKNNKPIENNLQEEVVIEKEEPLIGGDKDEGGCLIGAGYTWCEVKQKCLREWEEPCEEELSDEELIKKALVKKHDWDVDKIEITISRNDGQYATGGAGAGDPRGGGGIWFAAKVDGVWEIVWDGNGAIMCTDLEDYSDFPKDLIVECYDSKINKMVKR